MATSPSTENYSVGKGRVSFKKTGEPTFRLLGNAPEVEVTPSIEELPHFSSMEGTKTKDKVVVTEKSLDVRIVLEEWTAENLQLALLGAISTNTGGDSEIEIFSLNSIEGELKFEGRNEVGPKQNFHLFNVSLKPGGALNPISDEWGQIEIQGEALVNADGKFGVWSTTPQQGSTS